MKPSTIGGGGGGGGGAREGGEEERRVATVFFLPPDEAVALQQAQGLPGWAPPVLTVSSNTTTTITGLVLPRPDFVVFRYKLPAPDFAGSPARAKCYATPRRNRATFSSGEGSGSS